MKPAGFLCKIDKLGRIVIPKPIRKTYSLNEDDTVELFTDNDGIIIKRYGMKCTFCENSDDLTNFKGKPICSSCLKALSSK